MIGLVVSTVAGVLLLVAGSALAPRSDAGAC